MRPEDVTGTLEMPGRTRESAVGPDEREQVYGVTQASVRARMAGLLSGWIAEADGAIAGFAMGDAATGEVVGMAMPPEWRGRGSGVRC